MGATAARLPDENAPASSSAEERLPRILVRLLLQLFEQLALPLLQLLRNDDVYAREQVAASTALELRSALPFDPQQGSVLRAGLDLQRDRSVGRWDLDGRAERGLREEDRYVDDEVVAPPLVELRRLDPGDDVEVTGLPARVPRLALALEPDAGPVFDAGRDLDRVALRPALAPGAAATRTRILDHGAVAVTPRARLREGEEALALRDDTAPLALGADLRRRPRLRAGAVALGARGLERDRNLRLDAPERVLEREADLHLDVAPALAARLRAAGAAPTAEEPAEEVAEIAEVVDVEVAEVDVRALEAAAAVRGAEPVVLLPLLGIREQVVRTLHLLEPLLRAGIPRVPVRVVLARELAVGLLDLVGRGAFGDAEGLVRALRRGRHRSPSWPQQRRAQAGPRDRRAGSPSAAPRSLSPPPRRTAAKAAPRARADRTCRRPRSRRDPRAPKQTRAGDGPAARPPRASPPRAAPPPRALARGRRRSGAAP